MSFFLSRLLWIVLIFVVASGGCTFFATRPVQEMSDMSAAIRAAREVQADTLAPDLFRQSNEWYLKAKHEYKFKNFKLASDYAEKARTFAELAEFEAIRNGGNRTEQVPPDPFANPSLQEQSPPQKRDSPYPYPTPEGMSIDQYEQKKREEEDRIRASPSPAPQGPGNQPQYPQLSPPQTR